MAWLEFWGAGNCRVAGYLGGVDAARDQAAKKISLYKPATRRAGCVTTSR
jgi:hypothetical protein